MGVYPSYAHILHFYAYLELPFAVMMPKFRVWNILVIYDRNGKMDQLKNTRIAFLMPSLGNYTNKTSTNFVPPFCSRLSP